MILANIIMMSWQFRTLSIFYRVFGGICAFDFCSFNQIHCKALDRKEQVQTRCIAGASLEHDCTLVPWYNGEHWCSSSLVHLVRHCSSGALVQVCSCSLVQVGCTP